MFAVDAHRGSLRAQMAVGVDLHLEAAVAEDSFGHDGDHVDAVNLGGYDKGCGLVVGIGCARADGGDEGFRFADDAAVPVTRRGEKGHEAAAAFEGALQQHVGVGAGQHAAPVGIAVAGAQHAIADVAEHRAGIAADFVGRGVHGQGFSQLRNHC